MSASMYGKDASQMRHMENIYYPDPPTYNTTTKETKVVEQSYDVVEVEPVECTPGMWLHPVGLLRIFELAMFFMLQWLVQITCGNDACTMIMNVFGYTALGQVFVLIIFLGLSILCTLILVMMSLNGHRAFGKVMRAVEKLYALIGIPLMLIAGALGTWMAVLTRDPEVNYQGRGRAHIRGQWIAAAVFEFLMAGLYVFDLWLQSRPNYPFGIKDYQSEAYPTRLELEAGGVGGYETKTIKTTTTTTQQQRQFEQPQFEQLENPPAQYKSYNQPPPRDFYGQSQM